MSDYPKDLAVKTGSYQDRDGNTKNRYENIGKIMQGQGGLYLLLKKTFNPAGVETQPGKDMIVVSVFDQRERGDSQPARREAPPQQRDTGGSQGPRGGDPDQDIPFRQHERRTMA